MQRGKAKTKSVILSPSSFLDTHGASNENWHKSVHWLFKKNKNKIKERATMHQIEIYLFIYFVYVCVC